MPLIDHLFVYGTLKPDLAGGIGASERARLAAEATLLGCATTAGILIDLGSYPGLIEGEGQVHGVVYRLRDPAITLGWLDIYEGITGSADDEYLRLARRVTLAFGKNTSCWTYQLIQFKIEDAVIPSGSW